MGLWSPGETVLVSGYGWPKNSSAYYRTYLNVQILNAQNHFVWGGQVPCSSSGNVANAPTVTIDASFVPGVYYILVEDPRHLGSYVTKDTFTVPSPPVDLSTSTKTVDKASAVASDQLLYTLTITNTGSGTANGVVVSDQVPANSVYVLGSTTAGGSPVPDISGTSPLIGGITIPPLGPGASYVITFRTSVSVGAPDGAVIINTCYISFASLVYVKTASTLVNAPLMSLDKSVSPAGAALPGQILTYSVAFSNVGHSNAASIELRDLIPLEVTYVTGSATLPVLGGTLMFRHTEGGPFDLNDSAPVMEIMYVLPVASPGEGGTITFQVIVK